MKTIKELEKLLNEVKNKGYLLSESSYIDYDIEKIIDKNLETARRDYFNKYNVLKLKSDKIENFKLSENGKRKDFKEIKTEIKEYFNKRDDKALINELLKEVYLVFKYPKSKSYYESTKMNFEEIEENLQSQHKKELVFNYYSQYSLKDGIKSSLDKIISLFNLALELNICLDYSNLNYNSELKEIINTINTQQKEFTVKIFANGSIKIKLNNIEHHNKIRNLLIEEKFNSYHKEYYILLDVLDKEDRNNLNALIIYTNDINAFANINLNKKELDYYIAKYGDIAILDNSLDWNKQDMFNCVAHINKSDGFDYAESRINETDFNDYCKRKTLDIAKEYCNYHKGV